MPATIHRGGSRRRTISEINMVPFIDVMLVLLIIFMVTAPLITTGIVDLPSVGKSRPRPEHFVEIVVGADEQLRLRVDGKDSAPLRLADLAARVTEVQAGNAEHAGRDLRRPQRQVRDRRQGDGRAAARRRAARRPVGQAGHALSAWR